MSMARRDIIVVGGSAGGVEATRALVAGLPRDLAAAVFLVIHMPAYAPSALPSVLAAAGPLEAHHASDGEPIRCGEIYVAPPDHHLLLETGKVVVRRGPKENRFRPSIDALFRSAAYMYGPRVIGVLLSGVLDDGVSGLWTIKRLGGVTAVQEPASAMHAEMPRSATEQVEIDHVLPAAELGALLVRLVGQPVGARAEVEGAELERLRAEVDIAAANGAFDKGITEWGDITPFTCPECHGVLVRIAEGKLLRFRCRTGHAFTPSALLAGITDAVEETLRGSMRALDEQTVMLDHMSKHFRDAGRADVAVLFEAKAVDSKTRAQIVHDSLPRHEPLSLELPRG
jgi:two-component system chemotaxis response regulator CheB